VIAALTGWLKRRLELPGGTCTRDSPELVPAHRDLIFRKPFLRRLYLAHYREFARALRGVPPGAIVELGSGGGFLGDVMPGVVTTDAVAAPFVARRMVAERLEFPDGSLAGILMLNVFHHLPDPRVFLREAVRTLEPGGRVIMIEPAHTWLWSRLYRMFSLEPYDEKAAGWGFPPAGRFTGANVPQAWIVFERDRAVFEREFPEFRIVKVRHHTAFLYVLSGGIWYRSLAPGFSFPVFHMLETALTPAMRLLAGEMTVVLERRKAGMM
jgi:SAM-dependent methyltransferase